ncbi:MAG: hypothetical protein M1815_005104 [Lichina confinis]|nr:MAG: hypothetical protein M1815_005104 [Lichina confinis]
MVSWTTIQTVLFTFGPILLPRLIGYYRSIRSSSAAVRAQHVHVRPVPSGVRHALNILFAAAFLALLSSLVSLQPFNVFKATGSRLQIPTDVLFTRLASATGQPLTSRDEILRAKFTSLDLRLQYLAFGPDTVVDCVFCNTDEPKSYLYYALPSILAPHLMHIGLLGLLTSSLLFGVEAGVWRTQATIAGSALAAVELYLRASYDVRSNASTTRLDDIDFFHWRLLSYRGICIASADAVLGWMLYLSSTNRAFVKPLSLDERLRQTTELVDAAHRKLHALGVTRAAVANDARLRTVVGGYRDVEDHFMASIVDGDAHVRQAIRNVEARMDMNVVNLEADRYVEALILGSSPGGEYPGVNGGQTTSRAPSTGSKMTRSPPSSSTPVPVATSASAAPSPPDPPPETSIPLFPDQDTAPT